MPRLSRTEVERVMEASGGGTLESALDVFEVFASGSLTDEVYILEDVAGKRIAIAPTAVRDKYRRGGPTATIVPSPPPGARGPGDGQAAREKDGLPLPRPARVPASRPR